MEKTTQSDVFDEMERLIPPDLWRKYIGLSFGEMADVPELVEWAESLRDAEDEWYRSRHGMN